MSERVPFEQYVTMEGTNWSLLKHIDTSPADYKWARDNDRPDTAALKMGRYIHALIFEPDTIAQDYAVFTGEGTRASKEYKAFAAEHPDVTIFKANEVGLMEQTAQAVRAHPLVRPYLDMGGVYEHTLTWTDEETRLRCKCRLDWYIPEANILIDFKSAATVDMRRFVSNMMRFGYPGQLAHYSNGIRANYNKAPDQVILIAAEKSPPFDVLVMPIGDEMRTIAADHVADLMRKLKTCTDTNEWPGRYTEPMPLDRETSGVPTWIFGGDDDTIVFDEE
jgi:hypothetical protein